MPVQSDSAEADFNDSITAPDDNESPGLEEFEKERLKKLKSQPAFFNEHERHTLILLADIIIPKDRIGQRFGCRGH